MKCLKLSILFCISSIFLLTAQTEFIFRIETTTNNQFFSIPISGSGSNFNVDWGDSTTDTNATDTINHTYATPGVYTVIITGNISWLRISNNVVIRDMFLSIEQWGTNQWQSMEGSFYGCSNLVINATDTPDLSNVSTTRDMFRDATSLVDNGGAMGNWDMGNVTNMFNMFRGTTLFNADIGQWDVSSVENFSRMFQNATGFNQSLGDWDISSATGMNVMFGGASLSSGFYDQTLIGWATLSAGETQIPNGITINMGSSSYCNGETARNTLTSAPNNWSITDAGVDCSSLPNEAYFITTWQTTSADETITIPVNNASGTSNYYVDWGDGQSDSSVSGNISHTYASAGIYTVRIAGIFPHIFFDNVGDRNKILTIESWGAIQWQSMENAFAGCSNLVLNATNVPDLKDVINTSGMFFQASSFVDNGGAMGNWDMGNVTNMFVMFRSTTLFNANIGQWDVSNVENFSRMFQNATNFNQSLGNWDISSATEMNVMFGGASLSTSFYDQTLIGWATLDTGENQIPSNITIDMGSSNYCVGENARNTLTSAPNNWSIADLGIDCDSFSADEYFITTWETTVPNETITIPVNDVSSVSIYVVDWGDNQSDSSVNGSISHTYASAGTYSVRIFGVVPQIFFNNSGDKDKILSIEQWGNIEWESMESAFSGCSNLVLNATDTPNLIDVTNMNGMFFQASSFVDNGGAIGDWDVSSVVLMASLFQATPFNSDINTWNMQSVEDIDDMFSQTTHFNQPLNDWQFPNLTRLFGVFNQATAFNQDIGNWDVSSIESFGNMFQEATAFNQSLGNWDISSATGLPNMLRFSGLSPENYDATLIGWATLNAGETQIPSNVTLGAGLLQYCFSESERTLLTNAPFNWTINGDLQICDDYFITTWQTTSANETIAIPTNSVDTYNYTIRWGDGQFDTSVTGDITHTYTNPGIYTVAIRGDFPAIFFNGIGDRNKILSIEQWGNILWSRMFRSFLGCTNLVLNATDTPDLTNVSDMQEMFRNTSSLVDNGGQLNNWDVSNVEIMGQVFWNSSVNEDLSNWDVSNVGNFEQMFEGASNFNQSLGAWDISSAVSMTEMLSDSGLSTENYDATLIGWATLEAGEAQIPTGVVFRANGLTYCNGASARNTLSSAPFNWVFLAGDTFDCSSLSVDDVSANKLTVYPNPVSNILYLEDTTQQLTKVEVFNISGQKVYSKTGNLNQIDMQSFDTGLYMIKLHTQSSTKTLKTVKK